MDTRVLATFGALARTGSFTSAAAELHLAQSTVTAHIQALEKELRLRLVDRLPGGAVLTEAGKRVLDKATLVLAAEAELRGEQAEHGPIEGTVRIGAPESLCGQLLPPVVAALRRRHPGVDVTLNPVGTAAAIDALRAGALSLALLIEPSIDAADLVVERLGTLEIAFVADRGTPVTATSWAELAQWHWFLLEEGCAYSDEVARLLPGARATRLGSMEATRACVAAGLGLAVLPSFAVDERRLARFAGPPLTEPDLLLVRHARRSAGRALHVVEDEVRRGAAKLIS
ncbi:MAG TPA: LysR family transcriptional regulator [Pseudonocardiaceae bacterium]|nr:LysR family transcriptional regulator [Pseudonocardiaceae bacterium]